MQEPDNAFLGAAFSGLSFDFRTGSGYVPARPLIRRSYCRVRRTHGLYGAF